MRIKSLGKKLRKCLPPTFRNAREQVSPPTNSFTKQTSVEVGEEFLALTREQERLKMFNKAREVPKETPERWELANQIAKSYLQEEYEFYEKSFRDKMKHEAIAAEMHVHKNTVANKINKVAELLTALYHA